MSTAERTDRSTTGIAPASVLRAPPHTEYATVLRRVQDAGLLRRRQGSYLVRAALLLLAFGGVWAGFAFVGNSWFQLAVAAAVGAVTVQCVFLAHDAAHKQIFRSATANDLLALFLGDGVGGTSLG